MEDNAMIKPATPDEMLDCLRNPTPDKRSIAELDNVIDEIIERNPEWVEQIMKIVEGRKS
jgi:hypothetical protein